VQVVDGAIFDPGKSGLQSLSIDGSSGRTTHFDMDQVEAMDETRGAATMNLPAEAVQEVVVSRVTPPLFQSLNAAGAVQVTTRSGARTGTAICLAICATNFSVGRVSGGASDYSASSMVWRRRRGDQGQGFFVYRRGTH